MALPAAFLSSGLDPRTLSNLTRGTNGRGTLSPPTAAEGGPPAADSDSVELADRIAPLSAGRLAVDGSGVYHLVQASRLQFSAQSLSVRTDAGQSGRSALGALGSVLGASGASNSGLIGRLREALHRLGLAERSIRDLLLVGGMIEKLDPGAFQKLVEAMEALAAGALGGSTGSATPAPRADPAPASASGSRFELSYVSLSISMTELTARAGGGENGAGAEVTARSFELRFERLEIAFSRQAAQAMQQADPVVLDVAGNGLDLRTTSEGVLFDLTGSGRAVRTAFVRGDDALLFYDANANDRLDDGSELVGNRVPGLDGMGDLASMDADGDGRVTPLDPLWRGLRVFQDWNGDGRSTPDEVRLLDDLGITGLSALWERQDAEDGEGLHRAGSSSFTRADGSRGLMLDYYFGYRSQDQS